MGGKCSSIRRSEEHTSELQSRQYLVCRLLLEKKNTVTVTVSSCGSLITGMSAAGAAAGASWAIAAPIGSMALSASRRLCIFFFFNDTATTEIYTLSLHDALPILFRSDFNGEPVCRGQAQSRGAAWKDRKSTRLNSSHANISYAVFCLKKKNT